MNEERQEFFESLSLLVRGNLSVIDAIASLKLEAKSKKFKVALQQVEDELAGGSSLSNALTSAKILTPETVSLIRLGEETGRLSEQLSAIVETSKRSNAFKAEIQSALLYPGFVLGLVLIVGTVMVWYVFPKFIVLFSNVGGKLPLPTRIIIGLGEFFNRYGIVVVPLFFAVLAVAAYLLFVYQKTKIAGDRLLLALPITGPLFRNMELTRMSYSLGSQLSAGISLPEAFVSLEHSTYLIPFRDLYDRISQRVLEGEPLSKAMEGEDAGHDYLPLHIIRLIASAERSGTLSETFRTLSATYDEKASGVAKNFSALLEPVVISVVGLLVGLVALGVLGPIYGLIGTIN